MLSRNLTKMSFLSKKFSTNLVWFLDFAVVRSMYLLCLLFYFFAIFLLVDLNSIHSWIDLWFTSKHKNNILIYFCFITSYRKLIFLTWGESFSLKLSTEKVDIKMRIYSINTWMLSTFLSLLNAYLFFFPLCMKRTKFFCFHSVFLSDLIAPPPQKKTSMKKWFTIIWRTLWKVHFNSGENMVSF